MLVCLVNRVVEDAMLLEALAADLHTSTKIPASAAADAHGGCAAASNVPGL
jgi:hypothetical protein